MADQIRPVYQYDPARQEIRPVLSDADLKDLVGNFPDIFRSAGAGAVRGAIDVASVPGTIGDMLNRGIDRGLQAFGAPPAPLAPALDEATLAKLAERFFGPPHIPQSSAGRLAEGGTRVAAGAALGGPLLAGFKRATQANLDDLAAIFKGGK